MPLSSLKSVDFTQLLEADLKFYTIDRMTEQNKSLFPSIFFNGVKKKKKYK